QLRVGRGAHSTLRAGARRLRHSAPDTQGKCPMAPRRGGAAPREPPAPHDQRGGEMSRIAKGTRPSRRLLAAVAAVSATAFVLAGCTSGGSGDEDSDGTSAPTPEGDDGPKVVRVLAV